MKSSEPHTLPNLILFPRQLVLATAEGRLMGPLLFPFPAGRITPRTNTILPKMFCSFWSLVKRGSHDCRTGSCSTSHEFSRRCPVLEALPGSAGERKENCRQLPSCCWTPAWAKLTVGWLSLQKPQTATHQRRLFRKYSKFPAKEGNAALPEESAHDVVLLPACPRGTVRTPGTRGLQAQAGNTHSPKAPRYAPSQESGASSRKGKLWIKAGWREPVQGSTTSNNHPHRNLPSS